MAYRTVEATRRRAIKKIGRYEEQTCLRRFIGKKENETRTKNPCLFTND